MQVYVIFEEEYKKTIWGLETLDAINEKCALLKYNLVFVSIDELSEEIKTLIVVGTTPSWVMNIVDKARKYDIKCITVSCHIDFILDDVSSVLLNHKQASQKCLDYFKKCGRVKTALYGMNRDSYADSIKSNFFNDKDIFFSDEGYEKFYRNKEKYDSVICTNYITAISLINHLKDDNIMIPKDYFIASFGDTLIGKKMKPSLTTITLDHRELGVQAVLSYAHIIKQQKTISMNIQIPCKLLIGESTDNIEYHEVNDILLRKYANNFLDNFEVNEIQNFEMILRSCSENDIKLINGLMGKKSYLSLATELFSSEGALKYRIKRLLKIGNLTKTEELFELFGKYL